MYIRFVVHKNDPNSGRRQGLFQALATLRDEAMLLPHDLSAYEEIYDWFKKNLKKAAKLYSVIQAARKKSIAELVQR